MSRRIDKLKQKVSRPRSLGVAQMSVNGTIILPVYLCCIDCNSRFSGAVCECVMYVIVEGPTWQGQQNHLKMTVEA